MAICMLGAGEQVFEDLVGIFTDVQNELFVIGSDLADPDYPENKRNTPRATEGMASALERIEKTGNADTRVIPGHGPMATKSDLRAARETWLAINQRLEAMAKEGRSVDEVIKAAPTREFDARVGGQAAQTSEGFLRQAYGGVLAQRR